MKRTWPLNRLKVLKIAAFNVPARGRCALALSAYDVTPFCGGEPVELRISHGSSHSSISSKISALYACFL